MILSHKYKFIIETSSRRALHKQKTKSLRSLQLTDSVSDGASVRVAFTCELIKRPAIKATRTVRVWPEKSVKTQVKSETEFETEIKVEIEFAIRNGFKKSSKFWHRSRCPAAAS